MKFLIDAQLPSALCQWLRARGHEAVHVIDIGLGCASDEAQKTIGVAILANTGQFSSSLCK